LKTGYGIVMSDCPFQVRAVYTSQESDGTVREAGVVGVGTSPRSLGAIVKNVKSAEDTAIALVNPSDAISHTWIHLISEEGWLPSAWPPTKELLIPPHGQIAAFVSELFPQVEE